MGNWRAMIIIMCNYIWLRAPKFVVFDYYMYRGACLINYFLRSSLRSTQLPGELVVVVLVDRLAGTWLTISSPKYIIITTFALHNWYSIQQNMKIIYLIQ